MEVKLNEKESIVYEAIIQYVSTRGFVPSRRELQAMTDTTGWELSRSLASLQEKQLIEVKHRTPRAIVVRGYRFVKE